MDKYEMTTKTLTIHQYQHEAIIGMKRGSDTIYSVMDRLIETNNNLDSLEEQMKKLEWAFDDLVKAVESLREYYGVHT